MNKRFKLAAYEIPKGFLNLNESSASILTDVISKRLEVH